MKPKNFDKINDYKFHINGEEFLIELDFSTQKDIWIFPQYTEMENVQNCIYFQINWQIKNIEVFKAKLGQGKSFSNINKLIDFGVSEIKTMDSFIEFVKREVELLRVHFKH